MNRAFVTVFLIIGIACVAGADADSTSLNACFHPIFTDNMVIQRDADARIRGTAKPGADVLVKIASQEKKAKADEKGAWSLSLDPVKAGGPFEMSCLSEGSSTTLKNIMFGDVWLCSGQSNMEFEVRRSIDSDKEIKAANYPEIRLFTVARKVSQEPIDDLKGKWDLCSPSTVPAFSAVGYFFGRELYNELKVPIGLIDSSWGGTPAESWTVKGSLESEPEFKPILDRYQAAISDYPEKMKEYQVSLKKWETGNDGKIFHQDSGNEGEKQNWQSQNFDDSDWKSMELPVYWENVRGNEKLDGAVWFRKLIVIPADMAGKSQTLSLGPIDDFDTTYFNGVKVGGIGKETENFWEVRRVYNVPAELVKEGKAVVAIRVFDHAGNGGIYGGKEDMYLGGDLGDVNNISLAGNWGFKVEKAYNPADLKPRQKPSPPLGSDSPFSPSGLYNGMISPFTFFRIKGAIWYQGESNAGRAYQYRKLLPAMIKSWRESFAEGDFPFFIVQLANFKDPVTEPSSSFWAELREAQDLTARNCPNCGMATAIDIGDAKDIHPKNKQEVGRRLALVALKQTYGKDIVCSGPRYDSMSVDADKIRIKFKNIGGGLVSKDGGKLLQFTVAGADKIFKWADAQIDGDTVVVSNPGISSPVAVRYAWADNPEGMNLYNKEGLPADPFRTDDWHGVTFGKN